MDRHYTKVDFHGIGLMVFGLEVLSSMALLFGGIGALYIMFTGEGTLWSFIIISFGGIVSAFVLYAFAEFLQLLMKIEVNTRKMEKEMGVLVPKKIIRKK
jgi:hypothetical protein